MTLMGGRDAYLLDVGGPVNDVHEDVADGLTGVVNGDPRPAVIGVRGENFDGSRFVVSYIVQPVAPILQASSLLDVAEDP